MKLSWANNYCEFKCIIFSWLFAIWFSGNTEISSSWAKMSHIIEEEHLILLVQRNYFISNCIGNRNLPQGNLQQRDQECNIHGKMSERKSMDGMRKEKLGPEVTLCFDKSLTSELQNDLKGGCDEVGDGLFSQVILSVISPHKQRTNVWMSWRGIWSNALHHHELDFTADISRSYTLLQPRNHQCVILKCKVCI